ncbi:MAG TPA: heme o synthase [Tepidisphaeraceae bacterium]|jgi:protoheme IX farnesyltransferase
METASDVREFQTVGALALESSPLASGVRQRCVDFYELTKPRMNFLVVITTMVGYYMASGGLGDWRRVLATLFGTALTAAGASVFNQFVERRLDVLMKRTANRPLPAGRVRPVDALLFATLISVLGVGTLAVFVNPITATLGALTLLLYVLLYTPAKRYTSLCTIIGAVPGAIPPVMGFTAVNGVVTTDAIALFSILFFWQMPHFLAIAILYRDDYARGGFRMLPVVDQKMSMTARQIVLYSITMIPVSLLPALLGMTGSKYPVAALILGIAFCGFGLVLARSKTRADARQLFLASIVYLPTLLIAMMIDRL